MQLGVVFPQTEIGADAGAVRAFAQAAEEIGYRHLLAYDHVLGADISGRSDWPGPYTAVDVARAFLGADRNRDGELSRAEARQLTLGSASFEELDRNHDGIVTRWEFDDAMGR